MYIDPNSGGMLFQALLILFGVISGSVLIFSSKIKMFFARMSRSVRERDEDSNEVSEPDVDSETE